MSETTTATDDVALQIIKHPGLLSYCVESIARYVKTLAVDQPFALYGCGAVSRDLLSDHGDCFAGRTFTFVVSAPEPEQTFHGHRVRGIDELRDQPPPLVLLTSGVYRDEMIASLDFMNREQVVPLDEMVRHALQQGVFSERILASADDQDIREKVSSLVVGVLRNSDHPALNAFLLENFDRLVAAYPHRTTNDSTNERSPFVYPYY
jgi:hypothetical protein